MTKIIIVLSFLTVSAVSPEDDDAASGESLKEEMREKIATVKKLIDDVSTSDKEKITTIKEILDVSTLAETCEGSGWKKK